MIRLSNKSVKIASQLMKTIYACLFLLALTASATLSGCASLPFSEPPRLNLTNIQIKQIGLIEQEFLLTMRIQNPNVESLDIRGMSFDLDINGDPFATGVSNQPVFIPAYGEKTFDVSVSSTLNGILNQFDSLVKNGNIDYLLTGKMKLEGVPFTVPFKQSGEVALFSRK